MKRCALLGVVLLACVLLVARPSPVCSQKAEEPAQKSAITPQEGKAAGDTSAQPPKEKREGFQKEAQKMIGDLDKKITALGKKVKKEGSKIEAEARQGWDELKAKQKVAKNKVKNLSGKGEEVWEKAKSEADAALDEVRKAYDKAVSHFK